MRFFLPGSCTLRGHLKRKLRLSAVALTLFAPSAFGSTATTTTFTITANGVPLTMVDTHSTVKLTAEVKAGASKVTTGQVSFCDASFLRSCLDFRQVGTVQLTKDGTATLRFIPGPGEHKYKAVFLGTIKEDSSSSAVSMLTVNGGPAPHRTKTSLSASGSNGSYTLTANISAPSSALPLTPGGTVYFQDKSNANAVLGKAILPSGPPAVNYLAPSQPFVKSISEFSGRAAAVGDFNGDGKPDMVLCKKEACPVVALGNGDGTFHDAPGLPPLATPFNSLQVGDFNQDGKLDLIVLYGNLESYDQVNYFYAGAGDGSFLKPTKIPLKSSAGETGGVRSVADFNNDGIPDLLIQYRYQIGIALGSGDGSFEVGWTKERNFQDTYRVGVTGDFDGDGLQDFAAIAVNSGRQTLAFFFGSADGSFSERDPGFFVDSFTTGDFNGDGRTDLAVNFYDYYADHVYPIFLLFEVRPDRTFKLNRVQGSDAIYQNSAGVLIGDFNLDGIADAAFYTYNQTIDGVQNDQILMLGNADGSFTEVVRNQMPSTEDLSNAVGFAAADFDGDGLPDLAAVGTQAGTGYWSYGVLLTKAGQTGVANIQPPAGAGVHNVVARYSGEDNFVTSVSQPLPLSALPADAPVVTLSSSALQFGGQPVSEASNAKTIVVTNAGTAPLLISNIALRLASDFDATSFATSNSCPAALAAGASCKIRVRFVPGSVGSKQKVLVITDNAANSPQEVTLAGSGVKP